ncbi:MAG TPA: nuclear transport factor 2 family protein [Pseudomonadaceae bacterium]|nr:nuclear transport factor 2 family protein [Pseudomonadaceae bacterium]
MHAMRRRFRFSTLLPAVAALILLQACSESNGPPPGSTAVDDSAQRAALQAQLAQLETRAERLQDLQAIKRLQRSFGYYMEEGLVDEVVGLFADNATFEFARDGMYRGKARIRDYLLALYGGQSGLREGQLNEYLQLMPVITLADDGQTAEARWRAIMLLGEYGGEALWGEGPYENAYVKEDGVWKISRLHWFQTILVPYKGGWGRHEDVNKGIWVSDTLAPDAAPTQDYGSWPTTFLPPFSFSNPVGRYVPTDAAAGERP